MKMLDYYGISYYCLQPPHSKEVKLRDRIRKYNSLLPDLIYSIHGNANSNTSVKGACCIVWSQKELADKHVEHLKQKGIPTHGIGIHYYKNDTWTDLGLIEDTVSPAIITENGFFTNNSERELMKTDAYQWEIANVAFLDIIWFLNGR